VPSPSASSGHPAAITPAAGEVMRRGPIHGTTQVRRVALGAAVGQVIESYDFIGFATAAALYLGPAFFPADDPMAGTLSALAVLAAGFAARPLGGVIGGHLGDRFGRKPVLVASLLVMGLATFAIGLLPTYQQIGLWAPSLLVAVRILQGLAYGAEWGGAILITYEHSPWLEKGRFTGWVQAGFPVGLLTANLVFLASVELPGDWAWRVPFLCSIALVIVGLLVRAKVPESPVFEEVRDDGGLVRSPLVEVVRREWRDLVRGFGLRVAETGGYGLAITYLTSYLINSEQALAEKDETILALCVAAGAGVLATLGWSRLTDRIGRRPQYLAVTAFNACWAAPMFLLVNAGQLWLTVAVFVVSFAISQNALAGSQGAWFPELFPPNVRSSGASLAYQLSSVISGATPYLATVLQLSFGWIGPALLFVGYSVIGLVSACLTAETWTPALRAQVRSLTSPATAGTAPLPSNREPPPDKRGR